MSPAAQQHLATRARVRVRARRTVAAIAILIAAGELAGCAGISNPYQRGRAGVARTTSTPTTPADAADPAAERGGRIPASAQMAQNQIAPNAGRATPQAALERYASLYINWTATSVIASERGLASISLGQARAQALQAAADAARDPELTNSQVSNAGQVVAVTHGQGAAVGEWVIVTREQTSGQGDYAGLPPTLHVIYAQVTASPDGWVVSQWQPQN
jgi:hypothetical protein